MRPTVVTRNWQHFLGYIEFTQYSFQHLRALRIPAVRAVWYRQMYFTGIDALGIIALLALLFGALIVTQLTLVTGANSELFVKMIILLVREAGPLLAAMLIIARSSAAIAVELGLMRINGGIDELAREGINPIQLLVVPRVLATTVSVVVLGFYFQVIAILGGLAVSALFQNVSFMSQMDLVLQLISPSEIITKPLRMFTFGAAIGVISCYHGMYVRKLPTEVPVAAVNAVMQSLIYVFAIDAVFVFFFYYAS
jgi:phospholipid/cholesterol/gamma-HCH transport system permease protein